MELVLEPWVFVPIMISAIVVIWIPMITEARSPNGKRGKMTRVAHLIVVIAWSLALLATLWAYSLFKDQLPRLLQ